MRDSRLKEAFERIKLNDGESSKIYNEILKNTLTSQVIEDNQDDGNKRKIIFFLIAAAAILFGGIGIYTYNAGKTKPVSTTTTVLTSTTSTTTKAEEKYNIESLFASGYPEILSKNFNGTLINTEIDNETFKPILDILKKYNFKVVKNAILDTKESLYALSNRKTGLKLTVIDDKYILVENGRRKEVIESPGDLLTDLIKEIEKVYNQSVLSRKFNIFSRNLNIITEQATEINNKLSASTSQINEEIRNNLFNYLSNEGNLSNVESIVKTDRYIEFRQDKNFYKIYDNGLVEFANKDYPDSNYYRINSLNVLKDFIKEVNPLEETLLNFSFDSIRTDEPKNTIIKISEGSVSHILSFIKEAGFKKATDVPQTQGIYTYKLIKSDGTSNMSIINDKYIAFEYASKGNIVTEYYVDESGKIPELKNLIDKNFDAGFYVEVKRIIDSIIPGIEKDSYIINIIGNKDINNKLKAEKKAELISLIKLMGVTDILKKAPTSNNKSYNISVNSYNMTFIKGNVVYIQGPDRNYYFLVNTDSWNKINAILSDPKSYN